MKEAKIKKFYKNAMCWHLIRHGYSGFKAEMEVKKWTMREEKI